MKFPGVQGPIPQRLSSVDDVDAFWTKDLEDRLEDGYWNEQWKDCKEQDNVIFKREYRRGYKVGRVESIAYTAVLLIDLQYATHDPRLTNIDIYGDMVRYRDIIDTLIVRILFNKVPEIPKEKDE